jgi:hypothetical protein
MPAMAIALQWSRAMQANTSRTSIHDPDGVPHAIVGLTWAFAVGVAIFAFAALMIGGVASKVALLAVPFAIFSLARRAGAKRAAPDGADQ